MRLAWTAILLLVLRLSAAGVDGVVYPGTEGMTFVWTVRADTVTVSIRNSGTTPVTDLYVSEHTVASPRLLQCLVDGKTLSPATEIDTVFAGTRATRWLIGSLTTEVRLKYYVTGYFNSHLNWAAWRTGPVFGVAYDPRCCKNRRGNIDNDPADVTDLSDLTALIAILLGEPHTIQCLAETNVDGDSGNQIDLTDLSMLIGYLTGSGVKIGYCPAP